MLDEIGNLEKQVNESDEPLPYILEETQLQKVIWPMRMVLDRKRDKVSQSGELQIDLAHFGVYK